MIQRIRYGNASSEKNIVDGIDEENQVKESVTVPSRLPIAVLSDSAFVER